MKNDYSKQFRPMLEIALGEANRFNSPVIVAEHFVLGAMRQQDWICFQDTFTAKYSYRQDNRGTRRVPFRTSSDWRDHHTLRAAIQDQSCSYTPSAACHFRSEKDERACHRERAYPARPHTRQTRHGLSGPAAHQR